MYVAKYRTRLPQCSDAEAERMFLTDGGLEAAMILRERLDLPELAAFHLLQTNDGRAALLRYFRAHVDLARAQGAGLVLESATWRASRDWARRLGYSPAALLAANTNAVELLLQLRRWEETRSTPIVISGSIGPGSGEEDAGSYQSADAAQGYHTDQVRALRRAGADLVTGAALSRVEEAIGIVRAAQTEDMPVVISFTVGADGRLPSGMTLGEAVRRCDAATEAGAVYYMVDCAHPAHVVDALSGSWTARIGGLRAKVAPQGQAGFRLAAVPEAGEPEAFADVCRRHDVSSGLIYTWRRKLLDAGAAQESDLPEALPAPVFAEALIGGDAVSASGTEHPAMIIDLPRDKRVSVFAAAPPALVAAALKALR